WRGTARRSVDRSVACGRNTPGAVASGGREGIADPPSSATAEYSRRGLPQSRGATLMPIFDQGYQHWSGSLSGHAWRWLAITRQGVRASMKNIFLRLVVIVAWLPAAGLATMLCLWGLLEQKSSLITSLLSFLSELFFPQILQDPKAYRVEV